MHGELLSVRLLGCVVVLMSINVASAPATPGVHPANPSLLKNPKATTWSVVNDTVMGGRSNGQVTLLADGPLFSGSLVTQGGGFVSVRTRDLVPIDDTYHLLKLRIKGDGRTWRLCLYLATDPRGVSHQVPVVTKPGETTEHVIDIGASVARWRGRRVKTAKPTNLSQVVGIGMLLADGNPGPFKISLLDLRAVKQD